MKVVQNRQNFHLKEMFQNSISSRIYSSSMFKFSWLKYSSPFSNFLILSSIRLKPGLIFQKSTFKAAGFFFFDVCS